MKKKLAYHITLLMLLCSLNTLFSQKISVTGSVTLEQLIQDNLIQNGCVEISNITSSINGESFGFRSYGQFNRAGSNFPFQSGIVLTSGSAESAGNTATTPTLSEGADNWPGDTDLETALGITNTTNATSIEFDLISTSSQLQFNYLFASEEYFETNPCNVSDGFAFLIKEASSTTEPYENIALIPGTSTPVNTNTIHHTIFNASGGVLCPAQNEQYLEGLGIGDTNYNGRTVTLTAATTIMPYVKYRIKLVIADQKDNQFDSAVFIEGNSFKILDLGEDVSTCAESTLLSADIGNNNATYKWFLNNAPILGTAPTLTATQSGSYSVEVTVPLPSGGGNCVETDNIIVELNVQEPVALIADYQLCDDSSNPTGHQTFTLSSKNSEVAEVNPFNNATISYHLTEEDAKANDNSVTVAIQNTSNPQPIYVRINNTDTGCTAYTSFNLVVNSVPYITTPTPLEVCDNDGEPDGFVFMDLTEKDDELTGGAPNLSVEYYYEESEAINGINQIRSLYRNTASEDKVYARVLNNETACVSAVVPVEIKVTISPLISSEMQYIDACDTDRDGFAEFNLTHVLHNILNGIPASDIVATYHVIRSDAEQGTNPILNETNYQNIIANEQTLYIRIEDNTTHCASVAPFEIHTNLLVTATEIQEFAVCDNNADPDDEMRFNLSFMKEYIANNIDFNADGILDVEVDFFKTETDRDANINALDQTLPFFAANLTTLYLRLRNTDNNCEDVGEILLLINPIILFDPADPLPYCDSDDDVTDGITDVDLHSLDDMITNGNTDFITRFFPTKADADSNTLTNQLPDIYNVKNTAVIHVRIENLETGCYTSGSFEIQVVPAPDVTKPSNITICGTSETALINLEDKIPEIITSTFGIDVGFYTTLNDATNNTNAISNPDIYNASTQTLYVRAGDNTPGSTCFKIESFDIIINSTPILPPEGIKNFVVCDGDANGEAQFLFSTKDAEILNGQTGKDVIYFENPDFTGRIDKTSLFTSDDRTIYVRIENSTDPNCFETSSFEIKVASEIVFNPLIGFVTCDTADKSGKQTFNLNEKRDEIIKDAPEPLNVSFHLTETQAENNSGALPDAYTNVFNPQTLYVRIQDKNSLCFVVETLDITITLLPEVTPAAPLELCDDDTDGLIVFDLTQADFEILDRNLGAPPVVSFFETEADIIDDTKKITTPNAYRSDSKTIYIKITNEIGCYSVIPLELVVNPFPSTNTIGTLEDCYKGTYDLSQVNALLIEEANTFNITYHSTASEAEDGSGAMGATFNYTTPGNYTLWIRTENPSTGCFVITSFVLEINANPIANTPSNIEACDDDYDGFLSFDLSSTSNTSTQIRGTQNSSHVTITYYNTMTNAEAGTDPIASNYLAQDGEIIYARIENNTTGCYDTTQFRSIVNKKPLIPIDDIVTLCINDLPLIISAETGNPGDTYLWSNGETTPQITLASPTDIGFYTIDVKTPATGCSTIKSFEVIESAIADINFTTTVDFADPNRITIDVSGIGNYVFSLDGAEPQSSNVFEQAPIGPHTVTVIDLNGCNAVSKDVMVIDVPKFLTPNGDGYFDTWHITGVKQLVGTIIYIYDRYGKLLKTLPHTAPGWDGTFNGANMPSDDYWYVGHVVYKGEPFQIKGHFALKR
ncbi:choice-of-anchor L domain-containing protein [Mariniflexile ostreae]|uniref:Choice-of-anchor L domain-containing protein n=1 Tax=Mariniflexile ostreae TaxID=1520892 RepID=A0ABV5FFJ3_9FLAO